MPTLTWDIDEPLTFEPEFAFEVSGANAEVDDRSPIFPAPPSREQPLSESGNSSHRSTEDYQSDPKEISPLIRIPRDMHSGKKYEVLQQWECEVKEVDGDSILAEIQDLTEPSNQCEIVELSLKEFAVSDRLILKPGAVFYWSIGYETNSGGTIRRISELRVRRTAIWSQRMIDSLKEKALKMHENFTQQG